MSPTISLSQDIKPIPTHYRCRSKDVFDGSFERRHIDGLRYQGENKNRPLFTESKIENWRQPINPKKLLPIRVIGD